uniref:Coiled-coil domain containing 191 n=1 Tax=Labrus bergylta TaxID=56723 RepID=A0A3Q3FZT7_9LABR
MTFPGHNPHLFNWRKLGKIIKSNLKFVRLFCSMQRVETASELAVSEVFSQKKPHSGTNSLPVPLQSSDQLRDHDDAYSEAQALLSDWLSSKLRLQLELEEEEDDMMCSAGTRSPVALARPQPADLKYNNFDEEEEQSAVSSFLQDLMEREALDSEMMEELALDVGQTRKRFRDPIVTMEARHLQVRENRARRESREQEVERRKKQEVRRQEEMVQQEMLRLQRQREERRGLEQLVRQRERERVEGQRAARSLQSAPPLPSKQQQGDTEQLHKEEKIMTKVHMHDLKCLQKHFSGWYSVVLDRRLRLGKAMALCDWKRQLRAWRAWRAVLWAQQRQREVERTEEELRAENRQCQRAAESDRRRLLRQCLNNWHLWCRMEKEQRELLAQQQETRRKMTSLINAATTGKLKATGTQKYQHIMAPPEAVSTEPERTNKRKAPVGALTQPTQPWQVTRHHAAPSAAELHEVQRRGEGDGVPCLRSTGPLGSRFENRHAVQQQIITQQRNLLKEQQEQITRLKEEQSVVSLELDMERTAQLTQLSILRGHRPKSHTMEARAHQRAERRKEIEELKRKKEEEKLAEMKAAEEQRQREEEEEKHLAAEKKREEKRQEREREEEKIRQLKRQQELLQLARQHYHRNVLLRQGLAPWIRLLQLRQCNILVIYLSECFLGPLTHPLLTQEVESNLFNYCTSNYTSPKSDCCPFQLKDWRMIQEERAERYYRTCTLRRFLLALLDHVSQERLLEWDRQELSQEHNNRRVLRRCFLAWRQLPCQLRKEREKEVRRKRLGRRVTEVLPDFCSHPLW